MLDKQTPPLLPEDVLELLKRLDCYGAAEIMTAPAGQVRELVTVWLRVAAFYERVTDPLGRELVEALLFGAPAVPDTEPNHDKPSMPPPPFIQCLCGVDFLPHAPHCPNCGALVLQ